MIGAPPAPRGGWPKDRATRYALEVLAGKEIAGELVRLACRRHLVDIVAATKKGLLWDVDEVARVYAFFEELLFLEDGKPFKLEPFQCFIVGSLFGWWKADGSRRFRTAYVEASKGQGKSPLAAGLGLFGVLADGEPAAEVYAAAVTREQAMVVFRDAKRMADDSPEIAARIERLESALAVASTHSFFRPVSSEHRGLDGKRPHIALIDELHEHPTAMVYTKMRAGTKRRRNALVFIITNSGFSRESICWHLRDYSEKVLREQVSNDEWFPYVCQLDPCDDCKASGKRFPTDGCKKCDDWKDPKVWKKTNPGLGTILPVSYLEERVREAIGIPSERAMTQRLNFCIWTESVTIWIPADRWRACERAIDWNAMRGRPCFGGLDLATRRDFAAFGLVFPAVNPGEKTRLFLRTWLPETKFLERARQGKEPFHEWLARGWVETNEGDMIDQDLVKRRILEDFERFRISEVAFDPRFADKLVTELEGAGLTMIAHPQSFDGMSSATRSLETMAMRGELEHDGNGVGTWMIANVALDQNPQGYVRPSKKRSAESIDGAAAWVMAQARAILKPAEYQSIYATHEVLIV